MKTNPRMLAVLRHLQKEFALDYFEAELLGDDLVANLESLEMDILRFARAGNWKDLADAACALESLGANLGEAELQQFGVTLRAAAAAQDAQAEQVAWSLDKFLAEFGYRKEALGPT